MITFVTGDMFDLPAQARVNTVNCVGIMGKGVARAFARRYPAMLQAYKKACANDIIVPGFVWPWVCPTTGVIIFNMATKQHWQNPSTYLWVQLGLQGLAAMITGFRPAVVTMPLPGCGNGGLDPNVVRSQISKYLGWVDARVFVYEPE